MSLGSSIWVTDWFQINFQENNGMAFSIEMGNKIFLTLFRIIAVGGLLYIINKLIKEGYKTGFIVCMVLITAGALGNIIDCVFYGRIWNYAGWFHGKVVDMLYFPIIRNAAGECVFFQPVFNIADSFITVAVFLIIIFYRKDLDASLEQIFPKKKSEQQ